MLVAVQAGCTPMDMNVQQKTHKMVGFSLLTNFYNLCGSDLFNELFAAGRGSSLNQHFIAVRNWRSNNVLDSFGHPILT